MNIKIWFDWWIWVKKDFSYLIYILKVIIEMRISINYWLKYLIYILEVIIEMRISINYRLKYYWSK